MSALEIPFGTQTAYTDDSWSLRLERDAGQIARVIPYELRGLHATVVQRSRVAGAAGLILSGSTARGQRTEISDLDYHLIGAEIDIRDVSRELDLHVLSEEELRGNVLTGDDFVQWSLRFGCVAFDHGAIRNALELIAQHRPWPDVARKNHVLKAPELLGREPNVGLATKAERVDSGVGQPGAGPKARSLNRRRRRLVPTIWAPDGAAGSTGARTRRGAVRLTRRP